MKASEVFDRTLARHGRALHAVKTITEGVIHAIADEVAKSRAAKTGYGPSARHQAIDATAITFNQCA